MLDLSIVIPSFRPSVVSLLDSIKRQTHISYETIVVGPNIVPDATHTIQDWGCPSRCVQIGSIKASGEYLIFLSDDGLIIDNALDMCVETLYSVGDCQLVAPYYENLNFTGNIKSQPPEYWNAWYHPTLRLPGIPSHYKTALLGCMKTNLFKEIGGLDCNFEHMNMNMTDLSCRLQNLGISVIVPTFYVLNCNWSYMSDAENRKPVQDAYEQNDLAYFQSLYASPNAVNTRRLIDYNNWMNQPSVWNRRFEVKRK